MKKILFSILLICFCMPAFPSELENAMQDFVESDNGQECKDLSDQLIALEKEYEEKCAFSADGPLKCDDGTEPDNNGCCTGETYTNMGEDGYNCCPEEGECYPPLPVKAGKTVVERPDPKTQRRKSAGSRVRK